MDVKTAVKIVEQMENDVESLCKCCMPKGTCCIGCREMAITTILNELKKKDEVIKELTKNENSNNFLKDSLKLQIEFNKLLKKNNVTMIGLRNLCIPFRDKYNFTDHQTLRIAREEVTKEELLQILEDKEVK